MVVPTARTATKASSIHHGMVGSAFRAAVNTWRIWENRPCFFGVSDSCFFSRAMGVRIRVSGGCTQRGRRACGHEGGGLLAGRVTGGVGEVLEVLGDVASPVLHGGR